MQAVLVLENGATFVGQHFGAPVNTSGEVGKSDGANKSLKRLLYVVLVSQFSRLEWLVILNR